MGGLLRLLTLPMEIGFRGASGLRNRLYDGGVLPVQRIPVPVISVGNLSVGGSGKTPLSAWLVRGLRARGETPALIVHGYGKDELILHRRWNPDCMVMAEQDRSFGAWKAARRGATVVVLDDGFQHRRLARDLDLVLIPSHTPTRTRLLPRGPFREPLSAVSRADLVAITQKESGQPVLRLEERLATLLNEPPLRIAFLPDCWTELTGRPAAAPDRDFLAICGIGDPDAFARTLREATGRDGEMLAFPDHHEYAGGDITEISRRLRDRALVTTEKDAVKLEEFADELPATLVLHLRVEVLEGEERFWSKVEGILASQGRSR